MTEWDVLSRVVAQGKDASKTAVKDVMSSPVLSGPRTDESRGGNFADGS